MEIERRAAPLEIRAAGRKLEGIAAPFNLETRVGGVVEVIMPGAFAASLSEGTDILALRDHNPAHVLGRTRSGTLRLSESERGLQYSLDLPSTSIANDLLELATRGDLGGVSFAFAVRPGGERLSGGRRELRNVFLGEISIMSSFAAYADGTTVNVRSRPPIEARDAGLRRALLRWRL